MKICSSVCLERPFVRRRHSRRVLYKDSLPIAAINAILKERDFNRMRLTGELM
jgi:hypothetical protein